MPQYQCKFWAIKNLSSERIAMERWHFPLLPRISISFDFTFIFSISRKQHLRCDTSPCGKKMPLNWSSKRIQRWHFLLWSQGRFSSQHKLLSSRETPPISQIQKSVKRSQFIKFKKCETPPISQIQKNAKRSQFSNYVGWKIWNMMNLIQLNLIKEFETKLGCLTYL